MYELGWKDKFKRGKPFKVLKTEKDWAEWRGEDVEKETKEIPEFHNIFPKPYQGEKEDDDSSHK